MTVSAFIYHYGNATKLLHDLEEVHGHLGQAEIKELAVGINFITFGCNGRKYNRIHHT